MAGDSKIEWTDSTWNPIVGCSIVSPGCTNCYAMKMAARLEMMFSGTSGARQYLGTTKKVNGNAVWTGKVARAPDDILTQPLRWKKPRCVFVNSMGDLFHESIPDEDIDSVFAVMALAPQHTFQVLTKRAERMREYLTFARSRLGSEVLGTYEHIYNAMGALGDEGLTEPHPYRFTYPYGMPWPLPNVWLGVSCERQQEADERIPHLLQTSAAIRFVSAEPLLGAIDLYNGDPDPRLYGHTATHTFIGDWWEPGDNPKGPSRHGVDWVIVGGESGPHARPMHPDWARSLRDQCGAADVPFFFKQWGEFSFETRPGTEVILPDLEPNQRAMWGDGETNHIVATRVGKKSAGRLLDGKEHNDFPNPRPSSPEATTQASSKGERAVVGTDGVK